MPKAHDQTPISKPALAAEMREELADTRKLVSDLWWFIENVGDDTPDRTSRFFALRERVRFVMWRI